MVLWGSEGGIPRFEVGDSELLNVLEFMEGAVLCHDVYVYQSFPLIVFNQYEEGKLDT